MTEANQVFRARIQTVIRLQNQAVLSFSEQIIKSLKRLQIDVMLLQRIAFKMDQLQVHQHQWSHQHIHALTLQQEQTIMAQIIHSPTFDPYSDLPVLCPSHPDPRTLSNEEVATRIHLLQNLSSEQSSFAPLNLSPEEQAPERPQGQLKIEGFCAFSQPSIRNFLDEVQESCSLCIWDQIQH